MLRRLSPIQPDSFEFTPANLEWAQTQMTKYPEGRQASAVIPVLWRAHEQEGWLSRPAIEYVANLLGMANIRVLEVATFYFMFQLHPVGSVVHMQVCGTTTCMICGAEDLIRVCREKIAPTSHTLSADGRFSWEEVECLGACTNAPMVQIGKDFYEDLTPEKLSDLIDAFAAGEVPVPGPQNSRFSSEPITGLTSLTDLRDGPSDFNASVAVAVDLKDTVKRIDGTEVPNLSKWQGGAEQETPPNENDPAVQERAEAASDRAGEKGADEAAEADKERVEGEGERDVEAGDVQTSNAPGRLAGARHGVADDLRRIDGLTEDTERRLNELGIWHFDQIAGWNEDELAWINKELGSSERQEISREWVSQAGSLHGERTADKASETAPSASKDDKNV